MGTIRQQNLAKAIVENMASDSPLNKGELLESVGYAKSVAEAKPTEILEQKGVIEELEVLGFSERRAKEVVASIMTDITAEPNARLKAADMTFKVHGSYAPEKTLGVQIKADVKDLDEYNLLREKYEEELRNKLLQ